MKTNRTKNKIKKILLLIVFIIEALILYLCLKDARFCDTCELPLSECAGHSVAETTTTVQKTSKTTATTTKPTATTKVTTTAKPAVTTKVTTAAKPAVTTKVTTAATTKVTTTAKPAVTTKVTTAATTAVTTTAKPAVTTSEVPEITDPNEYYGESIGNPLSSYYNTSVIARNPWDMYYYNGKLFIGGGDYGANVGAMSIFAYNGSEWENVCVTNDHAISRFSMINGKIYATGVDSLGTWEVGNYYIYDGASWNVFYNLPHAVHAYDVIKCEDGILFAIGTENAYYSPAQLKNNDGEWVNVPLYKNEKNIVGDATYSYFRIYNLFETENGIYAFVSEAKANSFNNSIYKYEDGKLVLQNTIASIGITSYKQNGNRLWQDYLGTSVTRNGYCYMTSGYIYKTNDFRSTTPIPAPNDAAVSDLLYRDGVLYALGFIQSSATKFDGFIWEIDEDDNFTTICEFKTKDGYPLSFEYDGSYFYVGVGNRENSSAVGNMYRIEPKNKD